MTAPGQRFSTVASVSVMSQLETLSDRVRCMGEIRDFSSLRRFELTLLKVIESLSGSVRTVMEEKEEDARQVHNMRNIVRALQEENKHTQEKYRQCRRHAKMLEEEVQRARSDAIRFHGLYNAKNLECDQLNAQVNFLGADVKEKQKELWNLVCLNQETNEHRLPPGASPTTSKSNVGSPNKTPKRGASGTPTRQLGGATPSRGTPGSAKSRQGGGGAAARQSPQRAKPRSTGDTVGVRPLPSEPLLLDQGPPEPLKHGVVFGAHYQPLSVSEFDQARIVDLAALKSVELDMFAATDGQLLCLLEDMFLDVGALALLKTTKIKLRNFLLSVFRSYRENPFHNFTHAFCVTQMTYVFLNSGVSARLRPIDNVTLLLAAVCHDMDHPGINNKFIEATAAPLSLIYPQGPFLESYHATLALHTLAEVDCNLLSELPGQEAKQVRDNMVSCIIATDMAQHFAFLDKLKHVQHLDALEVPADRLLLMQMLIKCADISNEVRPFSVCRRWGFNLLDEFFAQGDLEGKVGIPVTPFMDRRTVTLPGCQIGFIDNVLMPAFKALTVHVPELVHCVDRLQANQGTWSKMAEEAKAAKAKQDKDETKDGSPAKAADGVNDKANGEEEANGAGAAGTAASNGEGVKAVDATVNAAPAPAPAPDVKAGETGGQNA